MQCWFVIYKELLHYLEISCGLNTTSKSLSSKLVQHLSHWHTHLSHLIVKNAEDVHNESRIVSRVVIILCNATQKSQQIMRKRLIDFQIVNFQVGSIFIQLKLLEISFCISHNYRRQSSFSSYNESFVIDIVYTW